MAPGDQLRAWRQAEGWTVYMLADEMRCSTTTVHHWQAGRRRPSEARRAQIEELSGIPADSWPRPPTDPSLVRSRRESKRRIYHRRKAAAVCVDCESPVERCGHCGHQSARCDECIAYREQREAA